MISNPAAKMSLRRRPNAFTEQGVAMLSSVWRSERAILVNIEIILAYFCLRQMLAGHAALGHKVFEPEKRSDVQFRVVFDAIHKLMTLVTTNVPRMGFHGRRED